MLYTIHLTRKGYRISKLSKDYDHVESYDYTGKSCNCPAGSYNRYCRHQDIVKEFKSTNRINTGWFYSYEEKKWYQPLAV